MKKMFAIVMAFCFLVLGATVSSAEVNYGMYLAPKITYSFYTGDYIKNDAFNGSTKSGTGSFGGGLSLGYDFYEFYDIPVRVELEYLMRSDAKFDVQGETMKAQAPKTVFANAFLDYQNSSNLTPYLTAGAGLGFIENQSRFAWNVGTGVRFEVTDNVDVDFSVKYVDYGRYELDDFDANLTAIDTSLGVSYTF